MQNFHQWGVVSLFHGLPSDSVRAIAQDRDGLMWFGTDNGLAKYDGRRVQSVSSRGLKSEKILALKVSKDGTLWIGTEAGATRFYKNTFTLIKETEGLKIVAINENDDGEIILASENGQIFECRQNSDDSLDIETIYPRSLNRIKDTVQVTSFIIKKDRYILGTLGRSLITVEDDEANEVFSRPRPYYINALIKDKQNNLWYGTDAKRSDSGLYKAEDITRPENISTEVGAVAAFAFDVKNRLWIGTTERGAFLFQNSEQVEHFTFENSAGGLRSNNIYAIFVDREGVVWFGTDRGVSRFDASSPFTKILSDSSNSNFVRSLFRASNGAIYAGTNRGLFIFEEGKWQEIEDFKGRVIFTIAEEPSGRILIGTTEGLFTLDNENLLDEDTRAIEIFQGKTYAAIFRRGVALISFGSGRIVFSNTSTASLFAENDKLWIGTGKDGVFSYNGQEVKEEKILEELKDNIVWQIAGNSNKRLWFATEKGLFVLQNGELTPVFSDVVVRDVFVNDRGDVWSATIGIGVLHTKYDEEFGWLLTNLSTEQGLPSQQTFALLPLENQILIGSNRGIAEYVPSRNQPLLIPTRIVSQRLHQPSELIDGINLDYPQNSLTIEVTALSNRTFPEQFQYAFLLKDSKGEVIGRSLSRDSQFLMENLAPDKYSVEIRAFDKDLIVSEPIKFQFTIASAPFPWVPTALAVLLAIASIALIWAVIERSRITNANRQLAAARFDLANEAERERRRIARDLHDQTLADLRNLMLMSDKLPTMENGEQTTEFRSEIESVSNEIRRICEDLSPSVLENVGFSASLEFLLSHTFMQTDKDFKYKFDGEDGLEERLDLSPNEQMQIYRIAQEVLNNIAKHSGADFVKMKVTDSEKKNIILEIENNGREFDADKAKKGRGISNIKSRASLINAQVFWSKSENGSMVFTLLKSKRSKED